MYKVLAKEALDKRSPVWHWMQEATALEPTVTNGLVAGRSRASQAKH